MIKNEIIDELPMIEVSAAEKRGPLWTPLPPVHWKLLSQGVVMTRDELDLFEERMSSAKVRATDPDLDGDPEVRKWLDDCDEALRKPWREIFRLARLGMWSENSAIESMRQAIWSGDEFKGKIDLVCSLTSMPDWEKHVGAHISKFEKPPAPVFNSRIPEVTV